jgi:hypothetical protein
MANNSSSSSSSGIGFVGLLTIVFITLKLLGKISWSWLWVLSPLWISALLTIAILAVVLGGAVVIGAVSGLLEEKRRIQSRERLALGARRTTGRIIDVEHKKDDNVIH